MSLEKQGSGGECDSKKWKNLRMGASEGSSEEAV